MSEKQPTALLDPSMSPVLMIRNGEPVTLLHWSEDFHEWDVHDAVGDVDSSWRSWALTDDGAVFVAARPLAQSLCSTETPPTPAQLLLERVLGGLQEQLLSAQDGDWGSMVVISAQLQDEILQLDAGQIPESIREAYEAPQGHGKRTE